MWIWTHWKGKYYSEMNALSRPHQTRKKGTVQRHREESCDTWDNFQETFVNYYWGEQAQTKVREQLSTGKFEDNFGNTREEYAMRQINKARYLDPPMNDKNIIQYIARHYKEEIRDVIAIQGIDNVEAILKYLKRVDSIKPIYRRFEQNRNEEENRRQGGNDGRSYERRPFNRDNRTRHQQQRWDGGRAFQDNNKKERETTETTSRNNNNFNSNGYPETRNYNNQRGNEYQRRQPEEIEHGRPRQETNQGRYEYQRRQTRSEGRNFNGRDERQNHNVRIAEVDRIVSEKNLQKERDDGRYRNERSEQQYE